MGTTPDGSTARAAAERDRRAATRFFWTWLIVATSMSVTGNVAHAVLKAPDDTLALAAGAALVPPVVLLAATHSVALLVRTRAGGATYWCALVMTVMLASCAFVLSFDALRSLAIGLGLPDSIAWLWPCAIDVAIAQATLCLLSMSRRHGIADPPIISNSAQPESAEPHPHRRTPPAADAEPSVPAQKSLRPTLLDRADATADIRGDGAARRWTPVAEAIVRQGVTSKDPALVATILAHHEAGMPPSTIGRTFKVHHTTVGRILSAVEGPAG